MTRSASPVLLLAVVVLAGCSITGSAKPTPPPKTLSEARFKYLVHRAAQHLACGIPHGKPTSYAQVRAQLKTFVKAYERFLYGLQGLTPPARDAVPFRHLLGAMNTLDRVLYRLVGAVDARDVRRIKNVLKQMRRLQARFNTRFHVHHPHHLVCAKK
jgi:hypothetical protein